MPLLWPKHMSALSRPRAFLRRAILHPHNPHQKLTPASAPAPARFGAVFRAMDCLLPWSVGGFADSAGAAEYFGGRWRADAVAVRESAAAAGGAHRVAKGQLHGEQLPGEGLGAVVWPGASRAHQRRRPGEYNAVPRRGGLFLWEQCRRAVREGALFLFVASFDEVHAASHYMTSPIARGQVSGRG
jgi:hypothetical protein